MLLQFLLQVQDNRGPCDTPADVDRLLDRMQTQKEKTEALKDQMRVFKIVFGLKSPALKLTQPLPDLTASLKSGRSAPSGTVRTCPACTC